MVDNRRRSRNPADMEEKQFDERVVHVNRVARVVKGGRRFHFQALVAIGDHKGKVGIGVSKGSDVSAAVQKAVEVAKKNMITVNLYNDTLPHDSHAKVGGSNILIKPAGSGTGLIAGGVVRVILEVAGVRNALSKSLGSSNKINGAYATIAALSSIEASKNWNTRRDKTITVTPKADKPVVEEVVEVKEVKKSKAAAKTAKPTKAEVTKTGAKK
ncbi:MAG TPA: 30S ribosomal protein S5 [Candidatus Saccharimonadales bacterium]|nr:30S ribosomal protein S5 [Candidatus Saccharimonadales bacterium]